MRRIKWVPSSTMDVRGANTFPLHNRLPIPLFGHVDRLIRLFGVLSIFSRSFLEQIKLGGDFTSFRELKDF